MTRRLGVSALVYLAGDVAVMAGGFLVTVLLVRHLPVAEYGTLAAVNMYAMVVSGIMAPVLSGSITHDAGIADPLAAVARAKAVILAGLAWTALLGGALLLLGPILLNGVYRSVPFSPYLWWGTVLGAGMALSALPLAHLHARGRPVAHRIAGLGSAACGWIATIWVVAVEHAGVGRLVTVQALAAAGAGLAIAGVWWLRAPGRGIAWGALPAAVRFCLPLVLYGLLGTIGTIAGRVVVERLVSIDDLGRYQLAFQLALPLQFVLSAINLAWLPYYLRIDRERGPEEVVPLYRLYIRHVLILGIVAVLGIALCADLVAGLIGGGRYRCPWTLELPIVLNVLLATAAWTIQANPLFAAGRQRLFPLCTAIGCGATIALAFASAPLWGAVGVAWATVCGSVAMLLPAWLARRRQFLLPGLAVPLWLAAASAAIALIAVGTLVPPDARSWVSWAVRLGVVCAVAIGFVRLRWIDLGLLRAVLLARRQQASGASPLPPPAPP